MTTREALYRLVDSIPAAQLDDARQRLEPLSDPLLVALANAPVDDEPTTPLVKVEALDASAAPRRLGFLADGIAVPDDFNRMGEAEIEALFGIES